MFRHFIWQPHNNQKIIVFFPLINPTRNRTSNRKLVFEKAALAWLWKEKSVKIRLLWLWIHEKKNPTIFLKSSFFQNVVRHSSRLLMISFIRILYCAFFVLIISFFSGAFLSRVNLRIIVAGRGSFWENWQTQPLKLLFSRQLGAVT